MDRLAYMSLSNFRLLKVFLRLCVLQLTLSYNQVLLHLPVGLINISYFNLGGLVHSGLVVINS
jgi:hypothetical protein